MATMNIYAAIADIMKEGYAIGKNKRNPQQGYQYRGIDDVLNTFQPLMSKHGIFCVPEVLEATREDRQTAKGTSLIYSVLKVRYTFYASDGSSVSAVVVGEGMDSGDKASNKALSAAMKYAIFQTFAVPTEEMVDSDAETPEPSRPKEPGQGGGPKFTCECCGAELKPYTGGNGKPVSLRAHAEQSRKKFGKILCIDCIRKEQNKEEKT